MGALNFEVLDALDIMIAVFLLYQVYRLLKGTQPFAFLLVWWLSTYYTAWSKSWK